ncbi:FemAB family protein [Komarekiella sp. 'clone 1']|uniref:FemAB family protein n=1 Tax=Komarekiella delphini-convector SJRDD-AB1 TaxID=2593771 RepID=A0AA40SZP6_9NOST|nr:FemAB family protein [Komarekiella delphini-convector]MBD6618276.1 FemAB family protein [Komarekiella delphini-convector SJRDD-AB1]
MDIQVISLSDPLWSDSLKKLRHDIYHLPEYLCLEANRLRTIAEAILISDGEKMLFVPYLVRSCEDVVPDGTDEQEIFDVLSPYAYAGILLSEAAINTPGFPDAALDNIKQEFRSRGICSAFFRLHPILNENFTTAFKAGTLTINGKTVSVDLRISNLWSKTRKGHRSTINKCKRMGMIAKMVPFSDYLDEFVAIYEETMGRVSATTGFYSFNSEYFTQMNDLLGASLHLCIVEYENQVACAGLYTECCGIVQSTLGGTKNQFVHLSPSSLETDYARTWAQERGNEFLHLGGGLGGSMEDKLYIFKAGFSELSHPFMTLRLIADEEKYHHLVKLRAKFLGVTASALLESGFFPAYRSC